MTDAGSMFEDAIESLAFARELTISEAANIPDDRWDYRPHPGARSVSDLVRHILQGTTFLVGEAADRDGDYLRRSPDEHVTAHCEELPESMTPTDLRAALERFHDTDVARIREAGAEQMQTPIRRFDGGHWTRLTYVFYAAGHEESHRGQIATYARTMGIVPALTQRIHGDAAE